MLVTILKYSILGYEQVGRARLAFDFFGKLSIWFKTKLEGLSNFLKFYQLKNVRTKTIGSLFKLDTSKCSCN